MEPLAERLIRHVATHYVSKNAMLIARSDAVISGHFFEIHRPKNHDGRFLEPRPKIWGRQLAYFRGLNDPVDSTALLLTDAELPHHHRKPLVSRLAAVNETLGWDLWNSRIRYFKPIRIDLYRHGRARNLEILMN